jgi:hypothetical protein
VSRVVLDTNIIISALISPNGVSAKIVAGLRLVDWMSSWLGGGEWRVLARKRLKLPFALRNPRWRVRWLALLSVFFRWQILAKPQRASSVRALMPLECYAAGSRPFCRPVDPQGLAERSGYGWCPECGGSIPPRLRCFVTRRRLRLAAASRPSVQILPSGPSPAPLR